MLHKFQHTKAIHYILLEYFDYNIYCNTFGEILFVKNEKYATLNFKLNSRFLGGHMDWVKGYYYHQFNYDA